MRKDIKKRWVEALRSGEYEQIFNKAIVRDERSCNGATKACVLGVLGHLYERETQDIGFCSDRTITMRVLTWAGFPCSCGMTIEVDRAKDDPRGPGVAYTSLVTANDKLKMSFDELANAIQKSPYL